MLPLKNKTVVICRALDQSSELSDKLIKLGARVISFPTIKILPPDDWTKFDEAINSLKRFDFIIFTSANAVKSFYARFSEIKSRVDFADVPVICVGGKTKTVCEQLGINVDYIPDDFSSEGIINKFENILTGKKILYPRSAIRREEIINRLMSIQTELTSIDIYRTVVPAKSDVDEVISILDQTSVDLFIFTSPSTFENFLILLSIDDPGNYFSGKYIAAIGPTTKKAIEQKNVKVSIVPNVHSMDGLLTAIENYFS